MSIIAAISNVQTSFPVDAITQGGVVATISLVFSLSIALLLSDSRFWDRWASSTLTICTSSLLITFAAIVVLKIIMIV